MAGTATAEDLYCAQLVSRLGRLTPMSPSQLPTSTFSTAW